MIRARRPPCIETARRARHAPPAGATAVVFLYTVVMAGGNLTIPLYSLWASQFGFGPVTTTLVFIAYVVGVAGTLLVAGSLSDAIGRRPVLALALALAALSTLGFALAEGLPVLLASRVLSGMATGLVTAAATSSIAEVVPGRKTASVLATAANVGGLSLGVIAAGLLAQFAPAPTRTVFWCYLAVCAAAGIAWSAVSETAGSGTRWQPRIRRPAFPSGAGRARSFLASGVLAAAASGVNGFFSSLAPAFLRDDLGIANLAVIGAGIGTLFAGALLSQVVAPPALLRRDTGTALLVIGVTVIEAALWIRSAPVFAVGTVLAGAAVGILFRHGLGVTDALCDPGNRAELSATYFLFIYSGLTVPVLLLGLVDQAAGTRISSTILAALVICIALAGLALGQTAGPAHPHTHTNNTDNTDGESHDRLRK
ncbi:MFS transporter [Streptomyces sp. TG1A-8]|uniref:MFS transporter n=1 Tax=Streptomyces sp. TG1A-8 TaxID=3051385 RepID=UPI00265B858F|nr:MFS transporter [Streptomyces sp. TG1A-8]MDO0929659.1 MFS transporter [Streptomyces sp. TG1A-8]